ncbi:phosphoenolpyruvate--protein phosphotransferase [Youxingia wuxianensis]|uniref:Phosphoenolpyruvate-protein phosphotransferase n=1 Tax=Youxingia wuxianensis TaxID=2763678 RepID=A0A926EN28_9FIRM|nr:phosphoenolpyruvate--protein phosphotransferase [Youxingia wuxianensis]MBC8584948.1 phosphoenolpyruvate--protein phosphotransferase [Youxingia wuxianensis]
MKRFNGIGASKGVAIGRLQFLGKKQMRVQMRLVEDVSAELERLRLARQQANETLMKLHAKALKEVGEADSMIFEIHQMMLQDLDYVETIQGYITNNKYCAEYAVQLAGEQFAQMFSSLDDEYMKERSADIIDISNRLVGLLTGRLQDDLSGYEREIVIAAEDLLPSETIQMDKSKVLAFVTSAGSKISHSAILARTMGIPAVVGVGSQLQELLSDGDKVIVDGFSGLLIADPDEKTVEEYSAKRQEYLAHLEKLKKLKGTESKTKDGIKIEINANIGNPADVDLVLENDGQGIGLFRSEFLYLESDDFPTEQAQFEAYRTVLQRMKGKRVIIRTLDLGADKTAPYFNMPREDNPAMGYRAIRICLDRKDIFKTQLRALYRASVYGKLAIMFPMITQVEEIREIKNMIEEIKLALDANGTPYADRIELGVMVETPAAALASDLLAKEVDFFSIGTNDLTQYTLAVDRMNGKIGHLYDPHNISVLRLIKLTARNAQENGIWCGICGESAADVSLTEIFLTMGVTEFSVAPAAILEMREKIQSISLSEIREEILTRL